MQSAYDSEITVDGDLYWVRRDFDLMRRIEQAFGPLNALDGKLRSAALTADEIDRLYRIVLQAQAARPEPDVMQAHIFEAGVRACCNDLAMIVMQLFAGNKLAVEWLAAEAKAKSDAGGEEAAGAGGPPLRSV